MKVPFLLKVPIEIFEREAYSFAIWLILILVGSLAGLISLLGSKDPLILFMLSGSFYITIISLTSTFIYDIAIGFLDMHRNNDKTNGTFPLQIGLLIIFIVMIFISAILFKNIIQTLPTTTTTTINYNQFYFYIGTILIGVYAYSINRLRNYPDLLKQVAFIDKVNKKDETEDGETL